MLLFVRRLQTIIQYNCKEKNMEMLFCIFVLYNFENN
jgi:hypothetical protein